jgi:hypothetical protein
VPLIGGVEASPLAVIGGGAAIAEIVRKVSHGLATKRIFLLKFSIAKIPSKTKNTPEETAQLKIDIQKSIACSDLLGEPSARSQLTRRA